MSEAYFNDWDVDEQRPLQIGSKSSVTVNSQLNSILFLVSFLALTLFGLGCIYSATYPLASDLGVSGFEFLLRQSIYIVIGTLIGFAVMVLPCKIISAFGYILTFLGIVVLGINVIALNSAIVSEVFLQIVIFVVLISMSDFFAQKENYIAKLRDIILPVVLDIALIFLILSQKNITFAILVFVLSVIMFACGGVGFGGVLLLFLFAVVPTFSTVFTNSETLESLLKILIPGLEQVSNQNSQEFLRIQAICSGGIFGKGIGLGLFKYGVIENLHTNFILCNICEEIGYVGIVSVVILFACYCFTGYSCAIYIRKRKKFESNLVTGMVSHIVISFALNVLSCFNIIPVGNFSLPFISYSATVIPFLVESFLIYRFAKDNGEGNE